VIVIAYSSASQDDTLSFIQTFILSMF